ncbi:MAG: N-acetylmuramoyl-L-alanine amidase [Chloroflexota bacterium]|nr:N-acetylmuramoyl-L-alanine amidase [Chloroflexota bacterium]
MSDQPASESPSTPGLRPGEREATDQPPPLHGPLTQAQLVSLVVPAVSFLLLAGLLLWGTLSSVQSGGAAIAPTRTATAALPTATPERLTLDRVNTVTVIADTPQPLAPTATITAPPPTVPAATPAPTAAPPTDVPATTVPSTAAPITPTQHSTLNTQHSPLAGRRIGLDPGHGPRNDLGAVLVDTDTGKLILAEDELNLDVALRCRALLQARGAHVTLTRDSKDHFSAPWPPDTNGDGIKSGEADDLQERIDILNAAQVEVFLSIHANSSSNPAKRHGIQGLYCATDDCATPAANKRLGLTVLDHLEAGLAAIGSPIQQRELRNDFWSDTPGEAPGHLFLLGPAALPRHPRALAMPGMIVESLYVTSPPEAADLLQDRVRQAIALAYADALQEFLTAGP